jgi:hypothetical protein
MKYVSWEKPKRKALKVKENGTENGGTFADKAVQAAGAAIETIKEKINKRGKKDDSNQ